MILVVYHGGMRSQGRPAADTPMPRTLRAMVMTLVFQPIFADDRRPTRQASERRMSLNNDMKLGLAALAVGNPL